jgi:hypothetical protein
MSNCAVKYIMVKRRLKLFTASHISQNGALIQLLLMQQRQITMAMSAYSHPP